MRTRRSVGQALLSLAGLAVVSMSGGSAWGGTVACTDQTCTWDIVVDGQNVASGSFQTDPNTGNISVNSPANVTGVGYTASVNTISGNIDPILSFGIGASTTGSASGSTFSFSFSLPIALEGTVFANSSVSYSLTSETSTGAAINPVVGNKIVRAREVDSGLIFPSFNKGVDVGDAFSFVGGPKTMNSPVFTASNSFTVDQSYDFMTVNIDFSLSGNSSVGLSGFVQQEVVPIPAAAWLFATGLLGLVGMARRKAA